MSRFIFVLPVTLHTALRRFAAEQRRSMASVVVDAITTYLATRT